MRNAFTFYQEQEKRALTFAPQPDGGVSVKATDTGIMVGVDVTLTKDNASALCRYLAEQCVLAEREGE